MSSRTIVELGFGIVALVFVVLLCKRLRAAIRRRRVRELRSVVLRALLRETVPAALGDIAGGSRAADPEEIGQVLLELPFAWLQISHPFGHEAHYELTAEGRAAAEKELK
jgi:hypothetical protein